MSSRLFRRSCLLICAVSLLPKFTSAEEPAPKLIDMHAPRQAIHKALLKQIDWNFDETPLADVAKKLHDELKIPVFLDRKALNDLGVSPNTPVTFKISGISAKSALCLLLDDFGLTSIARHEVLLITSPDVADNDLITVTYDVTDLVISDEGEGSDFDSLIDMITKTIKPITWDCVGGSGSISPFESAGIKALVCSQTDDVHEGVAELLADLRALRRPANEPKKANVLPAAVPADKRAPLELSEPEKTSRLIERKIRESLKKPVTLNFVEEPLLDAIGFLEKKPVKNSTSINAALASSKTTERVEWVAPNIACPQRRSIGNLTKPESRSMSRT